MAAHREEEERQGPASLQGGQGEGIPPALERDLYLEVGHEVDHISYTNRMKQLLGRERWWRFPEFIALCHLIAHPHPFSPREGWRLLRALGRFLRGRSRHTWRHLRDLPPCEVVICHPTYKPSFWPLMGHLAWRLAEGGVSCALVSFDRLLVLRPADGRVETKSLHGFAGWLHQAPGLEWVGRVGGRSLRLMALLHGLALSRDHAYWRQEQVRNPLYVWGQLWFSAHRRLLCRALLQRLRPKVVLSCVEQGPLGGEMVGAARERPGTLSVLVLAMDAPWRIWPFLSHQVWVPNRMVAEEVIEACRGRQAPPRVEVIGFTELDRLSQEGGGPEIPPDLLRKVGDRPVLVYLSEFTGLPSDWGEEALWRKASAWLAFTARMLPEWCVLYKPRPQREHERPPGAEHFRGLENLCVAPGELSLPRLLAWEQVRAVAAVTSSGLITAAARGKAAIRLDIGGDRYVWPVIRKLCYKEVRHPWELVAALRALPRGGLPRRETDRELLPYFGHTLSRMEALVQRALHTAWRDPSGNDR